MSTRIVWRAAAAALVAACCSQCTSERTDPSDAGLAGTGAVDGSSGAGGADAGAGGAEAGSGGSGGLGGSAAAGATGGASGGAPGTGGCPSTYDLPHHNGDLSTLCPPGESRQCSGCEGDWATAISPECTPDGTACVNLPKFCSPTIECGWNQGYACPELASTAEQAPITQFCASDLDCEAGHFCTVRLANRMVCDNAPVVYAKDVCPEAGVGSEQPDSAAPDGSNL